MTGKWFQIHLSTAIVLMFVTAMVLGLNLHPDSPRLDVSEQYKGQPRKPLGWPVPWYVDSIEYNIAGVRVDFKQRYFDKAGLAFDLIVFVVILVSVITSLEYFLRRREARNP